MPPPHSAVTLVSTMYYIYIVYIFIKKRKSSEQSEDPERQIHRLEGREKGVILGPNIF